MGISERFYDLLSLSRQNKLILYTLSHFNCLFCLPCYIHTSAILKANVLPGLCLPPVINYLYFYLFIDQKPQQTRN